MIDSLQERKEHLLAKSCTDSCHFLDDLINKCLVVGGDEFRRQATCLLDQLDTFFTKHAVGPNISNSVIVVGGSVDSSCLEMLQLGRESTKEQTSLRPVQLVVHQWWMTTQASGSENSSSRQRSPGGNSGTLFVCLQVSTIDSTQLSYRISASLTLLATKSLTLPVLGRILQKGYFIIDSVFYLISNLEHS